MSTSRHQEQQHEADVCDPDAARCVGMAPNGEFLKIRNLNSLKIATKGTKGARRLRGTEPRPHQWKQHTQRDERWPRFTQS